MTELIKPDFCNSLNGNCVPPTKYCKKCNHAFFYGEVYCSGRRYSFEFNPMFGFTFTAANGQPTKLQPGEGHKVWGMVNDWLKERGLK